MSTGDSSGGARETSSRRLTALAKFAWWLDAGIRIPGTNIRFGLDPVLGLIPGLGDTAGAVLAGWIVVEAIRLGVSRATLLRVIGNVALDAVLGAVPIIGDVFDFAWKANLRNITLLNRHLASPSGARRADRFFVACVLGGIIVLLVSALTLGIWLTRSLLRAVGV